MTVYGAVPAELRALGLKLVAQNEPVTTIQEAVYVALSGTTWTGPAREQFETSWNEQFNPSLNGLKLAFAGAGQECMSRADALEQVMGPTGATA